MLIRCCPPGSNGDSSVEEGFITIIQKKQVALGEFFQEAKRIFHKPRQGIRALQILVGIVKIEASDEGGYICLTSTYNVNNWELGR
jgi:hypothetical protein